MIGAALDDPTTGTGPELVRHECGGGWATVFVEPASGGARFVVVLSWSGARWEVARDCPNDVLGLADCLHDVGSTVVDGLVVVGQPSVRTPAEIDRAGWLERCGSQVQRRGDVGVCVARLQVLLSLVEQPSLMADGRFGPATHDAVISFQASHDLDVDGLAGPQTWEALIAASDPNQFVMRGVRILTAVDSGFVAVGSPRGVVEIWTSSDGISWTPFGLPPDAFGRDSVEGEDGVWCWLSELVWTGTEYVAVGGCRTDDFVHLPDGDVIQRPVRSTVWTSTDLRTWNPIDLPCPGVAYATDVAAEDSRVLIVGRCDGHGVAWTRPGDTWERHRSPFGRSYGHGELFGAQGEWFALDDGTIYRSADGVQWQALPAPEGSAGLVDIAAWNDGLYALGYQHPHDQPALWSRPIDDGESGTWTEIDGLSTSQDFHGGGDISTGEAGLIVSWAIGWGPSAHATQPPKVLDHGDVLVWLYLESQPTFVITDLDHNELLAVDTTLEPVEEGSRPPDHVEVDFDDEMVRFFDPTSGRELTALSFREMSDKWAPLAGGPRHAWWSGDGDNWDRLDDFPRTLPSLIAVDDRRVAAVDNEPPAIPDVVWHLLGETPPTRTWARLMV